jgi:ribosomal-protein-alanine N-acetyltransferase
MWPVVLHSERLVIRSPRFRDKRFWNQVRAENKEWLSPWEATFPIVPQEISHERTRKSSFTRMIRTIHKSAHEGSSYSLFIWREGNLIGQVTLGGVIYGALRGGHIGYWIDKNYANHGYMTEAVEMVTRFGFDALGLHRIEINVRPENGASCRVAEKAGYHFEGFRPLFLHIDGAWRDHNCYVRVNNSVG